MLTRLQRTLHHLAQADCNEATHSCRPHVNVFKGHNEREEGDTEISVRSKYEEDLLFEGCSANHIVDFLSRVHFSDFAKRRLTPIYLSSDKHRKHSGNRF